jgi:hypothetical protein
MPPADSEVYQGACKSGTYGICTDETLFHHHLALLGKTPMTKDEFELFKPQLKDPPQFTKHKRSPNKLFLYEISQLHDEPFRHDLSSFLGLNETLPELVQSSRPKSKAMDICQPRYKELRRVLLKNGQAASTWIRTYFMDHPDVVVSSPNRFRELLSTWMVDPCEERDLLNATSGSSS